MLHRPLLLITLLLLPLGASAAAKEKVQADPFQTPPALLKELTPDLIFNVLAGEISAHRHDLEQAFRYYREAATESGDARLAERAARFALFNKDKKELDKIVRLWVKRDPNSLDARRFALAVALDRGRDREAGRQLDNLIRLATAKGVDGFILAARSLIKSKNEKRALQLMARLVKEHPEDRNAWFAQALLATEHKEYTQAEAAVDRALKLQADWDKAILLKAQILKALERTEAALELLRKAVAASSDSVELRHAYARLLVQSEHYQAAYDQFQRLAGKDGEGAVLHYALGVLAMELKKYAEAEKHFSAIKDNRMRRDDASYYLGRIAEERKQTATALDWFRRIRGGEFELQARMKIADLLAGQGELAEARKVLSEARKQWATHAVGIYVAESAILKDNGVAAAQIWSLFDEALKAYPEDIELLYARALYAAGQKRLDILEQDLGLVLKKKPKHADALNALGYTLADMTDRHQEALGYIKQALALKPDSPAILDSMGWIQFRLGNHTEALDYLRKAAAKISDPEINSHLGEVLWSSGQQDEAKSTWRKALEAFPKSKILQETLKRLGVEL